jgi:hypothetical protein
LLSKFVIFGDSDEHYKSAYKDIINLSNVRYIGGLMESEKGIIKTIHRFHLSPKLNKYISLPLKKKWYSLYYNDSLMEKPDYFLFFSRYNILIESDYINYLRNKYPDAKMVLYFQDLIKTHPKLIIDEIKERFDLVISYDRFEAEKNSIEFYPSVYSSSDIDTYNLNNNSVLFLGKAKDRLMEIIHLYELLTKNDIECDFYLTQVPKDQQIYNDKIHYINWMDYNTYLSKVRKCGCLIELLQKDANSATFRTCESIVYNKKLLTNNKEILNLSLYKRGNISLMKSIDSIDVAFLKSPIKYFYTDEEKESFSPIHLLEFIENRI